MRYVDLNDGVGGDRGGWKSRGPIPARADLPGKICPLSPRLGKSCLMLGRIYPINIAGRQYLSSQFCSLILWTHPAPFLVFKQNIPHDEAKECPGYSNAQIGLAYLGVSPGLWYQLMILAVPLIL